jgi:hypothetical protein
LLTPTNSVLQDETGSAPDPSNSLVDPGFVSPYDVTVNVLAVRSYPAFRQAVIVAQLLPPSLMGDFHLAPPDSSARGLGAASTVVRWGTPTSGFQYTVRAPTPDIDGQPRPTVTGVAPLLERRYDAGSDQMTP